MKKLIQVTLLLSSIIMLGSSQADNKIVHVGVNAELFKSWHKVQDDYFLLVSAPTYNQQDSDSFTKGYRVSDSLNLKGQYDRKIYDYENRQSALNVFYQIKKSLRSNGYSELFNCEKEECGDVEGWQLYFNSLIGESKSSQYYIAAKDNSEEYTDEYIAFYICEIDSQTRVLVDIISSPQQHLFDVVVKTDDILRAIEKDGRTVVDGILFDPGSSVLKEESNEALKLMSMLIKENSKSRFVIVGHADNSGSFDSNMKLSDNRAKAVKNALLSQYQVPSQQLSAKGVGTLSPLTSNTDVEGRKQNRRVELVKL